MLFLCLKIFFARILDVSIGTVRTMLMVKGKTVVMTILAFLKFSFGLLLLEKL